MGDKTKKTLRKLLWASAILAGIVSILWVVEAAMDGRIEADSQIQLNRMQTECKTQGKNVQTEIENDGTIHLICK